jgi:hypothetical protein
MPSHRSASIRPSASASFQVDTRVERHVGRGDYGLHQLQLLREFVHYRPFLFGIRVTSASPFTPDTPGTADARRARPVVGTNVFGG